MAWVLAMLLAARGAEVPTDGLAAAVQSMRPRPDEPIAIVTPNRPAEKRANAILGEDDIVFSQAGSASETDLEQLGVTCAVFLQRQGVSRSSPWIVTGVGDCAALPPPMEVAPQSLEARHERNYRSGMNGATVGLIGLPLMAGVSVGGAYIAAEADPYAAYFLVAVGYFAAIGAPTAVGVGSVKAAWALRHSGVPVSVVAGTTSLVLLPVAIVAPAFGQGEVAAGCYVGAFVLGGVQMAMNTAAYRRSGLGPSPATRFHVRPVPLFAGDTRGLALTGEF